MNPENGSAVALRLQALDEYAVMDTAPEPAFDAIAHLASQICGQPMATVTLLDDQRQWFKARVGLDAPETAIEHAFCAHAIAAPEDIFMVDDATTDGRFSDNPYVIGAPNVRFYAGASIVTPQGIPVGTVCVIGTKADRLTSRQREALLNLAAQASALLELRRLTGDHSSWQRERARDHAHIRHLQQLLPVCPYCKNERDQEAYWHAVDNYLHACNHLPQVMDHCPKCDSHYLEAQQSSLRLPEPAHPSVLTLPAPKTTPEVTPSEPPANRKPAPSKFELSLAPAAPTLESELATLRYTVQVQAQKLADLQTSEAYFRHLTEYSLDLITILEADGTIRFESRSIQREFGHDPAHYRGRNAFDFVHPDDRATLMQAFAEALDKQGNTSLVRFRFQHADGSYRVLEGSGNNLLLDSAVRGIVFNSRDITEHVRLQEAVEAARKEKEETIACLIGEVAHDFNNVLTAIQGLAELTLPRVPADGCEARNLREIRACTERAAQLTRQLLAFSRRVVLQPRALQLQNWLQNLAPALEELLGPDIPLTITVEGDLRVWQDPAQLDQVITHLATNAKEAMPHGGQLTLLAQPIVLTPPSLPGQPVAQADNFIQLTVIDEGCGMSKNTLTRIFEPFFTEKTSGHHPGLGLCMCRGIVEQSGGHLTVSSQLGLGTSFQLYLPAVEAVDEDIPEPPTLSVLPGVPTVLFVDDEPVLREIGEAILLEGGYHVIIAEDGPDALAQLEALGNIPLDLLVTDVIMPGMTGVQLAEEILRQQPGTRTLLCSGYTRDALAGSGGIPPGLAFMPKPYSLSGLLDKVRELLNAPAPVAN